MWFVSGAILYVIFMTAIGALAHRKGRSVLGWLVLALLFSPMVGVILLALPSLRPDPVAVMPDVRYDPPSPPRHLTFEKTCPRCAEIVKQAAKVCRYCGHDFEAQGTQPEREPGDGFVVCPNCMQVAGADAAECRRCGHRFDVAADV